MDVVLILSTHFPVSLDLVVVLSDEHAETIFRSARRFPLHLSLHLSQRLYVATNDGAPKLPNREHPAVGDDVTPISR